MPAKNHLFQEQRGRLLKAHDNPYMREKILILLLMNDGKTYQEISDFLKIAYGTVAYWAVHGDPDNLDSLWDGRREGNFRKATKEYEELLLEVIEKEPAEYWYDFGIWTAARLAIHLEKETGIQLSGSQISRILQKKRDMLLNLEPQLQDRLGLQREEIIALCQRWNIAELALFGSVLTEQFHSNSDIDLLIRFAPNARQGLLTLAKIKYELESLLGREVDLVVKESIEKSENWIRRHEILKTAQIIYEQR